MKTYILRTVYQTKNLLFADEVALRTGSTAAYLIAQRELPFITHETVGSAPGGKLEVTVSTRSRLHRGNPLLLEVTARCAASDDATPFDVRPGLEAQEASLVALFTWSLPEVVGPKLGEALFFRPAEAADDSSWTWYDVSPIRVADAYGNAGKLASTLARAERQLDDLPPDHRDSAEAALRWWRYSQSVESPPDKLIAYWIILESVSSALCAEDSIRTRVEKLLAKAFPDLAATDNGRRIKKMKDVLYNARCRAVHGGKRDLTKPNTIVQVAQRAAEASISLILENSGAPNPPDDLLSGLGI